MKNEELNLGNRALSVQRKGIKVFHRNENNLSLQ